MKILWIIGGILAALILLYLFLIFPRAGAKRKYRAFLGQIYAHRGVFDNERIPENSLPAFQSAIRMGVGIEFDIHRTADGEVVVFHDATLQRMCGDPRRITDLTLDELRTLSLLETGEKIPTLKEVLALVADRVPLVVELKGENTDTSLCDAAMPILENYGGRYCIESFNPLLVARYGKLAPHVMRGVLVTKFKRDGEERGALGVILQNLLLNFLARPDFIAARHLYGRYFPIGLCRKLGAATVAWTIRSRKEYDTCQSDFDAYIAENVKELVK
jgi:glycerophosphoryl diester phosphodiesterase